MIRPFFLRSDGEDRSAGAYAARAERADGAWAVPRGAQESARREWYTVAQFAFRQDATVFGVFDAFDAKSTRSRRPLARHGTLACASSAVGLSSVVARVSPGPPSISGFPQNDGVDGRIGLSQCRRSATTAREEREPT